VPWEVAHCLQDAWILDATLAELLYYHVVTQPSVVIHHRHHSCFANHAETTGVISPVQRLR
jgi:hypothetical protein